MSDFILLTDSEDPSVAAAVQLLESWRVKQVSAEQLLEAMGDSGVRALLLVTADPTLLDVGYCSRTFSTAGSGADAGRPGAMARHVGSGVAAARCQRSIQ